MFCFVIFSKLILPFVTSQLRLRRHVRCRRAFCCSHVHSFHTTPLARSTQGAVDPSVEEEEEEVAAGRASC